MNYLLIGAGDCYHGEYPEGKVIAVDGGYERAVAAGLKVEIAIGDFDSLGYIPECEKITLTPEKDETDMAVALQYAVDHGADRIYICGALGGRLDHTIANIQNLTRFCDRAHLTIVSDDCMVDVVRNGSRSFGRCKYLSVFAVGTARGVNLIGTKYTLENAVLTDNFPLGVSNAVENFATVSVTDGTLIVITID